MGDAQRPQVSPPCNPCFWGCHSPPGDPTGVSSAELHWRLPLCLLHSCLLLVMPLDILGLLQILGFTLLSLLSASGHLENYLKNRCSFL